MSKSGTKNGNAPEESQELSFEDALKKLEAIVESMESQDLPLELLLARFDEGTKLSKLCQSKLADAELRIQQLEKKSSGEIALKPVRLEESEE